MKNTDKITSILYGVVSMLFISFIRQDGWRFTFSTVVAFVVGAFVLPPLITFMSDDKKDNY